MKMTIHSAMKPQIDQLSSYLAVNKTIQCIDPQDEKFIFFYVIESLRKTFLATITLIVTV